jgi:superfamily II DNA or RNA helicase
MNWEKLIAKNIDAGAVSRGRDYWRKGRVRSVEWRSSDDGKRLFSTVRGSGGNYDQVIRVDVDDESIEGDCTCPVAYNCKHVVAALYAANQDPIQSDAGDIAQPHAASGELFAFTGDPDPANAHASPSPQRAPPTMPLPYPIELWLTQVAAAQSNAGGNYPTDVTQRILYIFGRSAEHSSQGGIVRIFKARVKKSGEFASVGLYHNTNSYFSAPRYMLPSDTRILRQLSSITGRGYSFEFPVVGLDATLVRAIIETGRAYWMEPNRPALRWAEPRLASVEWAVLDNGDRQPALVPQPAAATIASLPPIYIDVSRNEGGLIESALSPAMAMAVAAAPALPAKWVERVSRELQTRNLDHSIPLPTRMEEETLTDFRPQPVLTLKSHQATRYDPRNWKDTILRFETATLVFDYLGVKVTGKTPLEITRVDGNRLLRAARNSTFERAARARLTSAGLLAAEKILTRGLSRELQGTLTITDATVEDNAFSGWTAFLEKSVPALRNEGWKIDIATDFRFDLTPISEWYADVDESSNQWFDLEIGIEVEGTRVSLIPILVRLIQASPTEWRPAALDAMADESKIIVPLGDGRRAALQLSRLKPLLATLFELYLREPTGGRVRLSPLDAARLAEMDRALDLRWLGGERMRQLGARLARFDGIVAVAAPADFHATLRLYQQQGLAWLQFLREYELSGVLADDMGLGKTVQTLAHLATEKAAGRLDLPALVVAPTSMMGTWQSEAARFAPGLKVMVSHGASRHAREEAFADFDLVLTTYALLARDEEKLLTQHWHLAILDEAQNIKNPKTKAATVACRLNARHRLCLTGTPMENHLGELWSLFRFLMPGLLGDEKAFKRDYRVPIEREGDLARQKFLARRVHPFLLRRTKDLVAHELPAKTLVTRAVEFESAQADLYETVRAAMDKRVREEIAAKGIAKSHIVVLDALLKLRQICCDPRLLKTGLKGKAPASAKLVTLMEMLEELLAEGRSILLFSQFTSMLALIEAELETRDIAYAKLTGTTRDRKKPIEQFQSGQVKLFLISLKAGGTGLTLTAADTVIHYDPWWNPAVENQATDRAHRIGQAKPVFVYKLIAKGTLEERIVEMQTKKGALAAGILDGDVSAASALDAKDLQALFEPMPE